MRSLIVLLQLICLDNCWGQYSLIWIVTQQQHAPLAYLLKKQAYGQQNEPSTAGEAGSYQWSQTAVTPEVRHEQTARCIGLNPLDHITTVNSPNGDNLGGDER